MSAIPHHSATLPPRIATYTGPLFDYEAPSIVLADVARGLSQVCRFAGQTDRYYTVAEHSMLVAALVLEDTRDIGLTQAALWHDAHEAFVGDVPTPLKPKLGPEYRVIVDRIDIAVASYLGIDPDTLHDPAIKRADRLAMLYEASILQPRSDAWAFTRELPHTEVNAILHGRGLQCFLPERAEQTFLHIHSCVTERCN